MRQGITTHLVSTLALVLAGTAHAEGTPQSAAPPAPTPSVGAGPGAQSTDATLDQKPATNPHSYTHDGFYMRLSPSYGFMGLFVDFPDKSRDMTGTGPGFSALWGGSLGNWVLGGGLWYAQTKNASFEEDGEFALGLDEGVIVSMMIAPFVDYYLDKNEGLHFLGSLGAVIGSASNGLGIDVGYGVGLLLGGGYDIWVAEQWSLGLMGTFTIAPGMEYSGLNLLGISEGNNPDDEIPYTPGYTTSQLHNVETGFGQAMLHITAAYH